MTNKQTYNRIATVLVAIMLVVIAFAVPMRTALAEETTSQNIFEGATVDLVAFNMSDEEEARHENLSPVYDTSDSRFCGIDLASTLEGISSTNKWSVVEIYINFQTPIDFTDDDFFRYTAMYKSSISYFPKISYFEGNSILSRAFKYDEESDKFLLDGESAQITKIKLNFPTSAYRNNLASIITPAPIKGEQGEIPPYRNLFEGCTVDLIAGADRYENLTPVYDVADVQYQGIDLAATLDGLEVSDSLSTVEIYINFQTPVSLGADSFFRYSDMDEFDVGSVPHYYPTLRVIEESGSARTIAYDVESDMFKLGKDTQLSRIRLLFSATSYSEHLGSILAPSIAYEAPDVGNRDDQGNDPGGDPLPSPQLPSLSSSGIGTFNLVLITAWLIAFAVFVILIVFKSGKHK